MNIVIRADAYPEIGTGHLMRSLALGQAFKDCGWRVTFVTYCESPGLIARLSAPVEGFDVLLLKDKSDSALPPHKNTWAVADGVAFDSRLHKSMKDAGYKLLIIDDMAALDFYHCDIILNQNLHAHSLRYNHEDGTRLLLGPDYILLRREFRGIKKIITDKCINVLITLGGADRDNFTQKVLNSIKSLRDIKITVVVGAGNPNIESIKTVKTAVPVTILQSVNDMAGVMASQDVAITSGGTTVWELAFMGIPSVVGRIAPIENYLVEGLNRLGLFIDCGWFKTATEDEIRGNLLKLSANMKLRKEMSALAQRLVDGHGRDRVIEAMRART
ncbi:MAG: UDP-2,4-diacetamido-2,4,6-trideoxy-beta-L-altropyranose hydrolase [Nitrospirota bacterium]